MTQETRAGGVLAAGVELLTDSAEEAKKTERGGAEQYAHRW